MARFIPENISSGALGLKIKNVLRVLDNDYIIRREVGGSGSWAPEIFIQRRSDRAWIYLLIDDSPFKGINPEGLFEAEHKNSFEAKLDSLKNNPGFPVGRLILMNACSPVQAAKLQQHYDPAGATAIIAKDDFLEYGSIMVQNFSRQLDPDEERRLLDRFFPERRIWGGVARRDFFTAGSQGAIYLDPRQEWAARLDLEPPAGHEKIAKDTSILLINGVAGSGKTVIALNRALILADKYPNQSILLLIHNTPITADLRYRLRREKGRLPNNLNIITFFAWLRGQWLNSFGSAFKPLHPRDIENYFRYLPDTEKRGLKISPAELVEECDYINGNLIEDHEQYLAWNRTGRGAALRREERSVVWRLRQGLKSRLRASGQRMWSDLPYELCLEGNHNKLNKFNHILIDEAQFCALSWFRSIQLSLAPEASLFLCADPNQGFMKHHRLSWKKFGFNVVGRTKKFRRCYRCSFEILSTANKMLDLLDPQDQDDYLKPEYELMPAGPKPRLVESGRGPQDALAYLGRTVETLITKGNCRLYDLMVIYGGAIPRKTIYKKLTGLLGPDSIWDLNDQNTKHDPPKGYGHDYIRMAGVDTATGLESRVVFLLGFENFWGEVAAMDSRSDQPDGDEEREEAVRKMYMAMTRAASQLILITYGQAPPMLKEIFA